MESKKTFVFVNHKSALQSGGNIYNAQITYHLQKAGHTVHHTNDVYAKDFIRKQYIILLDTIILDENFDTNAYDGENAYFLIHLWPSHNVGLPEEKKLKLIEKQQEVCQKFTLIFAGEHALHQCQSFYYGQLRKYFIIPPGVAPGWKIKENYSKTAGSFLMIGNICRRKRQLDVVNLFSKTEFPIHLSLAGRSEEPTYSDKIAKVMRKFPNRISWHAEIDYSEINDFMVNFDAIISFSEEENNSIALLESVASGIPIITTPTGNHLAFRKHQAGHVLNSFDIDDLSGVIHKMHTNTSFYGQLCNAVKKFKVNTWEESSSLFLDL